MSIDNPYYYYTTYYYASYYRRPLTPDEGTYAAGGTEPPAVVGADRDVVQVGAVAGQTTGAGHGLVEGCVDAAVGGHFAEQTGAVGAAQLLDLAVLQQRVDELGPLVAQLFERCGVGGEARLGLLAGGEALLGVQDLAQLVGGVHVELLARHPEKMLGQFRRLGGESGLDGL